MTVKSALRIGRSQKDLAEALAKDMLRPTQLDPDAMQDIKAGFSGRYHDGGRERFVGHMLIRGLSEHDIEERIRVFARHRLIYLVAACFFIIWAGANILVAPTFFGLWVSVALSIAAVFFLLLAARNDLMAWQCTERRFGSPKEYLVQRLQTLSRTIRR